MKKAFFSFLFFTLSIHANLYNTFYGAIEVNEPILIELIESKSFQRLRDIHQYGISYYTTHREEYNRYEHSMGVFFLLRIKGATIEEQIAGLLHDVSHTVFSHVGDWIFGKAYHEKDYQNEIHKGFLEKYGLADILKKYNFSVDQIMPEGHLFPMLEQKGPLLCADRIEYNLQGAFYQGFLSHQEIMEVVDDLAFIEGDWVSNKPHLMRKLAQFSLHMTENCWGSVENYLTSKALAEAILRASEIDLITNEDIHFATDSIVWSKLISSEDLYIKDKFNKIFHIKEYYNLTSDLAKANLMIKSKFRGIDPWIIRDNQKIKLTAFDTVFGKEYYEVKRRIEKGWTVIVQP